MLPELVKCLVAGVHPVQPTVVWGLKQPNHSNIYAILLWIGNDILRSMQKRRRSKIHTVDIGSYWILLLPSVGEVTQTLPPLSAGSNPHLVDESQRLPRGIQGTTVFQTPTSPPLAQWRTARGFVFFNVVKGVWRWKVLESLEILLEMHTYQLCMTQKLDTTLYL